MWGRGRTALRSVLGRELPAEDLADLMSEQLGLLRGGDPDDRPFDREVGMDGDVAEGDDVAPGNLGISCTELRGKPGGGLADHGQLLQHGALDQVAPQEVSLFDTV